MIQVFLTMFTHILLNLVKHIHRQKHKFLFAVNLCVVCVVCLVCMCVCMCVFVCLRCGICMECACRSTCICM